MRLRVVLAVLVTLALGATAPARAETVRARNLISKLRVHAERNAGYDRDRFAHWSDLDGDGCDTRAEVLMQESRTRVRKSSTCTVLTGRWLSVFDRRTWRRASDVDVDHHVALDEAWGSGARRWTATDRMRFANDLGYRWSLNAMTDNLNASKSDRDPSEWLPPARVCRYAITWAIVKYRWRLSIDSAERSVLADVLSGDCGGRSVRLPKRASSASVTSGMAASIEPA